MSSNSKMLQRVYDAQNKDELADAYSDWARQYDRDLLEQGYILPFYIEGATQKYRVLGEF